MSEKVSDPHVRRAVRESDGKDPWLEMYRAADFAFSAAVDAGELEKAYQEARNAERALHRITGPVTDVGVGTLVPLGCFTFVADVGWRSVTFVVPDGAEGRLDSLEWEKVPVWHLDDGSCMPVTSVVWRERARCRLRRFWLGR
jgi:hypothetical protein